MAGLVVLPLAGAAIAAATHATDRSTRFAAETAIVVSAAPGEGARGVEQVRHRIELLVGVLRLPVTAAGALELTREQDTLEGVARRLRVLPDARAGTVRVQATGSTRSEALLLAVAVASEGFRFARLVVLGSEGRAMEMVADFEEPATGRQTESPIFNISPERVTRIGENPRSGTTALRVECGPEPGCGPWVRVERFFRAGTQYVASGYARSPLGDSARLKMVVGSSGADVRTGAAVRLTRRWQRLSVAWTPREDVTAAGLGFQLAEPPRTTIDVDSVLMSSRRPAPGLELPDQLDPREELLALDEGRFAFLSPSRVVAERRSAPVGWALAGLGAGLLVALAGIGAGQAAQRRAEQTD